MRIRAALGAVAATMLLAACDAGVGTAITITGTDTATIVVSATFDGEAAEVLNEDAAVRQGLIDVFSNRTGQAPDLDLSADTVVAKAQVPYDRVPELAPITGVGSVRISADGRTTVVELVEVTDIKKAISAEAAKAKDDATLKQTLLDVTTISVAVTYPGGVHDAVLTSSTTDDPDLDTSGKTATLSRSAGDDVTGTLTVTGDLSSTNWLLYGGLGAAVIVGAAIVVARRR